MTQHGNTTHRVQPEAHSHGEFPGRGDALRRNEKSFAAIWLRWRGAMAATKAYVFVEVHFRYERNLGYTDASLAVRF